MMLQPSDRAHLFESLRPPEDYALDCAIGTTFTLDLLTLLTAPLAFTSFDWANEEGSLVHRPHALLATMQQYANRISLFCQTGKIALPKGASLLFSYLEESVIEVNAPKKGLFHPKVWLLRFTAPKQPVCYRLLCLSRNLTFDRAWDTILRLDGELTDGEIPANQPLSDFVRRLPELAHHGAVPQHTQQAVDLIQQEIQRVAFELPPGFQQLIFHPMGIAEASLSPISGPVDRLLIVSPFVSDDALKRLDKLGRRNVLISRPESLAPLQTDTLNQFEQLFQLSPGANPEDGDTDADSELPEQAALVGLHAKLYVADAGKTARIWTGSANATEAAFSRNVEFLVELVGPKATFGIDTLLAEPKDNEVNLRSLLEPFRPPAEPSPVLTDEWMEMAEDIQRQVLKWHLRAVVSPLEADSDQYRLDLYSQNQGAIQTFSDIQVSCYPLNNPHLAISLGSLIKPEITFAPMTCVALTSFIAFELRSQDGKRRLGSFVMNVPIEGMPENRRQKILRSLLSDKTQVLRLLMFLLADTKADARELAQAMGIGGTTTISVNGSSSGDSSYLPQLPLFEALIKALNRNPAQLDRIHSLVTDLRQCSEDESEDKPMLPDNFDEIWEPIYAARQTLDS
jgi:hypothetical protein